MPLQHSSSPQAFKANVKTLMGEIGGSPHVQSRAQALKIAYETKRRAGRKRGGKIKGYDTGGAPDAVQAVISALQSGTGQGTGVGGSPNMSTAAPTPAGAAQAPTTTPAAPVQNTGLGSANPMANQMVQTTPAVTTQMASAVAKPQGLGMHGGGMPHKAAGGLQGLMPTPWWSRQEARGMAMHTGPVMSAVPGRTDRHNVSVPSSSYVFPSDFVSHLGQNNSSAGMKVLSNMGFGSGSMVPNAPKLGHGMGIPRPPRPMGIPGDQGGARGQGKIGIPTPVVIAGGEFVAPPEAIMRVLKTTDMKHAHSVLDKWVMQVRKDHIKTLKGLPKPAKS